MKFTWQWGIIHNLWLNLRLCLLLFLLLELVNLSQPLGFPGGTRGKEPCYQCRRHKRLGFTGWGKSPGEGHGEPPQYSCLENPMDRGAEQATVHRVAKRRAWLKQFSMHACLNLCFLASCSHLVCSAVWISNLDLLLALIYLILNEFLTLIYYWLLIYTRLC